MTYKNSKLKKKYVKQKDQYKREGKCLGWVLSQLVIVKKKINPMLITDAKLMLSLLVVKIIKIVKRQLVVKEFMFYHQDREVLRGDNLVVDPVKNSKNRGKLDHSQM